MNNPTGTLGGVRVYSSPLAMTAVPRRKHIKSRSMSESYHRRIQKKWNKRYGLDYEPCAYMTADAVFVHPALMEQLRKAAEWNTAEQATAQRSDLRMTTRFGVSPMHSLFKLGGFA